MLAPKENQSHLLEDVQSLFAWADRIQYEALAHAHCQTVNKGDSRLEIRERWTISDPVGVAMLADAAEWTDLRTVVRVRAQRRIGDTTITQDRYYISRPCQRGATHRQPPVGGHALPWGIENRLHWDLDIAFRADAYRVCKDHGAENFAVIRHITLNLLQCNTQTRLGVAGKRFKAAWDTDYLAHLLEPQV